jgi:hypothetical protein
LGCHLGCIHTAKRWIAQPCKETRKENKRTPRLNIKSDDRLGNGLGLGLLLLAVLGQTLLADTGGLGVLLLVVRAEQVDIVVLFLGSGSLGGVQGDLGDFGAVDGVGLAGIARQRGELILKGGNVLVPTGGVGELLGVGARLQGLEAGNIGLGGRVATRKEGLVNIPCAGEACGRTMDRKNRRRSKGGQERYGGGGCVSDKRHHVSRLSASRLIARTNRQLVQDVSRRRKSKLMGRKVGAGRAENWEENSE